MDQIHTSKQMLTKVEQLSTDHTIHQDVFVESTKHLVKTCEMFTIDIGDWRRVQTVIGSKYFVSTLVEK